MKFHNIRIAILNKIELQSNDLILWGTPTILQFRSVINLLSKHGKFFNKIILRKCSYGKRIKINNRTFSFTKRGASPTIKKGWFEIYIEPQYYVMRNFTAAEIVVNTEFCVGGIFIPMVKTYKGRNESYHLEIKFHGAIFDPFIEFDEERNCSYLKKEVSIDIVCLLITLHQIYQPYFGDCIYFSDSLVLNKYSLALPSEDLSVLSSSIEYIYLIRVLHQPKS